MLVTLFGDARSVRNVVVVLMVHSLGVGPANRWSSPRGGTTFPINTSGCTSLGSTRGDPLSNRRVPF